VIASQYTKPGAKPTIKGIHTGHPSVTSDMVCTGNRLYLSLPVGPAPARRSNDWYELPVCAIWRQAVWLAWHGYKACGFWMFGRLAAPAGPPRRRVRGGLGVDHGARRTARPPPD